MTGTGYWVLAVRVETGTLGKDRVVRAFLPWSHRILGTQDNLTVPSACTTFCTHQIIGLALLEEVRTLNPDRTRLYMGSATQNLLEVALDAVALHVEFEAADRALTFVIGTANYRTIVNDVALAVVIEEEARVDAVNLLQIDRLAPAFGRIFDL